MLKKLFIFISVFGLFACKSIKIENGEIPSEYLNVAAQFVGDYQGEFNNQKGTLAILLDGNKLQISFSGHEGNDLIDSACESSIGQLISVSVNDLGDGEYELRRATFNFSPNKCAYWIIGDTIDVTIRIKNGQVKIVLALLENYALERNCRYEPPPPAGSGRRVCDPPYAEYMWGEFTRPLN